MMNDIKISVVLPLFNEESRAVQLLDVTRACLKGLGCPYEIVAVNDGSADRTHELLQQYSAVKDDVVYVPYTPNRGKGFAVKTGMLKARGKYRLFFDADLAVPLATVPAFIAEMKKGASDIVIGTRKIKDAVITRRQPFYREFLGKGFSRLTNVMLGTDYSDITCGFKCFSGEAAERIFSLQHIERWSFDAEILFLAKRCGFRVKEIAVTWHDNPASKVNVIRDIVRSFSELVRIRVHYL